MSYEIDLVPLPEADGAADRGPRLNPLDKEALAGIKSGLYTDAKDAAKDLAPRYKPNLWPDFSKEQRRDTIKAKQKKYDAMLARLYPSQA
ncbi:hypothetical protein [Sphingomonas sp. CFBP 13706]|uniref:hypothetical protein n=1 Tax=Sphingomonas sp. CFBP 13706 TaxID=2775314 RepID=UPI0017877987|nr:hypothetical protein [Sphingomonas sp. CFBP 13706]MBD8735705.1 hypothetical protein [Sphingomonas sp. CFBP 13706]